MLQGLKDRISNSFTILELSRKDILAIGIFVLLLAVMPLVIILVKQQQTLKSKASTLTPKSEVATVACPNKFIFGLNGPTPDKIKQLFTQPSLRFLPIGWKDFQPNSNSNFDFSGPDQIVNETITNGRTPTVKFCDGDCFPDWARQMETDIDRGYCCSSDYVCRVLKDDSGTAQAFQNAVKAMVGRYKDKIKYWDYGIEPNCRGYSPERYTKWLKIFSEAVRSADPNAVVIGGHIANAQWKGEYYFLDYLRSMYDNGAGPYFDIFAIDAYGQKRDENNNLTEALDYQGLEALRGLMNEKGDGNKKVWIGEWGIDGNVGEAKQAEMINSGLNYLASTSWIGAAFYHNYECELWSDDCRPGGAGYLGFGLLQSDGTEKQGYQVFKNASSACSTPTPTPYLRITFKDTSGANSPQTYQVYSWTCGSVTGGSFNSGCTFPT
ncbi:MAG: hypothetical protein V1808_05075, partial [Candidatus Daviesbacteria bacterium]